MKKLLGIVVLSLILFVNQTNKSFAMEYGYGELKLSNKVVNAFIKFIKGNRKNSPYLFSVAIDGLEYQYWICSEGLNRCRGGNHRIINKDCLKYSKKHGSGAKCSIFAHNRTVKWDNGINNKTKFKSKWTGAEIIAKLTELGFYGNDSTTTTKTEEKTENQKQKAEDKCKELGFEKGTEDFGDCVTITLSNQ